jgi:hypothetical protein
MKIDKIALAELERAVDAAGSQTRLSLGGWGDVDLDLLRDLVKLARGKDAPDEELLRDAHKWGFEQGWEAAADSIGHPVGISQAYGQWKKNR